MGELYFQEELKQAYKDYYLAKAILLNYGRHFYKPWQKYGHTRTEKIRRRFIRTSCMSSANGALPKESNIFKVKWCREV